MQELLKLARINYWDYWNDLSVFKISERQCHMFFVKETSKLTKKIILKPTKAQ